MRRAIFALLATALVTAGCASRSEVVYRTDYGYDPYCPPPYAYRYRAYPYGYAHGYGYGYRYRYHAAPYGPGAHDRYSTHPHPLVPLPPVPPPLVPPPPRL